MKTRKVKALHFAGAMFGLMASSVAFAHGPSRQKTTQAIEINAPAAKVWAVIGNFQDMSWWEGVVKTTGKGGNTANTATRVLTLKSGATISEWLTDYDTKNMTYSYYVDKIDVKVLPVDDYSGKIQVESEPGGKSKVVLEGAFYRGYPFNEPPPELNDEAAVKAVNALYHVTLDALKKKIEAMK
jgi:hypothetical protein